MDELDNLGDVDIDAANTLASTLTKTLDPAGLNPELGSRVLEAIVRVGNQAKIRLVSGDTPLLAFSDEEKEVLGTIRLAYKGIQRWLGDGQGDIELDTEVSRLQSYVMRHMVERVSPGLIKQRLFRR